MLFDNDRPLPVPEGLPPILDYVIRQSVIQRRANGLNVQYVEPETETLVEYSFGTLEQRDHFLKRLSEVHPGIPYAISGARA